MRRIVAAAVLCLTPLASHAWGRKGHEMINRIACEKLPADVPAFMKTPAACAQMEYQGPEPDRWYSKETEPELSSLAPDHFLDMEWANVLGTLPRKRLDYYAALYAAQPQHPDMTLTPEKVGAQPYAVVEVWERLKVAMRNYRDLQKQNQDTKPVEALVVYYAGWLGHYVADGSQPLHATYRYNGWVGANPNGYTTEHKIHSQFESVFVNENIAHDDVAKLVPANVVKHGDIVDDYLGYLKYSNTLVEKVYQLEKSKALEGKGTAESRTFVAERMAAGASELRDLIAYAWQESAKPLPPRKYTE